MYSGRVVSKGPSVTFSQFVFSCAWQREETGRAKIQVIERWCRELYVSKTVTHLRRYTVCQSAFWGPAPLPAQSEHSFQGSGGNRPSREIPAVVPQMGLSQPVAPPRVSLEWLGGSAFSSGAKTLCHSECHTHSLFPSSSETALADGNLLTRGKQV